MRPRVARVVAYETAKLDAADPPVGPAPVPAVTDYLADLLDVLGDIRDELAAIRAAVDR